VNSAKFFLKERQNSKKGQRHNAHPNRDFHIDRPSQKVQIHPFNLDVRDKSHKDASSQISAQFLGTFVQRGYLLLSKHEWHLEIKQRQELIAFHWS
jgi:hypothetical protein